MSSFFPDLKWSFHTWMGFMYAILVLAMVVVPYVRKFSSFADARAASLQAKISGQISDRFRVWMMAVITVIAAAVYIYCLACDDRSTLGGGEQHNNFFHATAQLTMRVFPFFIIGCFFAGVIEKYFRAGRIPLPKSMLGQGVFASLIPMCACAVIPLAQSMLHLHRIRVRAVITFLMVAPVMTPMIIPISWGVLGWNYLALRVAAVFILAMATGLFVERFAGIREEAGGAVLSCVGCSRSSSARPEHAGSAMMLSYNTTMNLIKYILVGIAIGAVFTVYLPPTIVGKYLGNGTLGLLFSVTLGIPLFICSGEEIVILSPLMNMGLPMGHAIAFTITGNAICITSISIMIPAFGKRVTAIMVAALFFGSIALGALINLLAPYWPTVFAYAGGV